MRFSIEQIASTVGGRLVAGDGSAIATGVSIDSRTIQNGDLFVAIWGDRFDGHDFLSAAIDNGASAVVAMIQAEDKLKASRVPAVIVDNTIESLARLAAHVRDMHDIQWVATTGSAGKTTTKEFIAAAVGSLGPVLKAPASFNNAIGVPLTILGLREEHVSASLEIGTNSPGEIRALSEIARPRVAVITNIGPAHLERFGSLEAIAREKSAILDSLTDDGVAILPEDSCHLDILKSAARNRAVTFGIGPLADVRADSIETLRSGETILTVGKNELRLRSTGMANVRNALAALAVARELGVRELDAIAALASVDPPKMRGRVRTGGGVTVLDHSYNANPISFASAMESLFLIPGSSRRWIVAGDMLELGASADSLHEDLGSSIARSTASNLLAVGNFAPKIAEGAVQAGMPEVSITQVSTASEAAEIAAGTARDGDLILVKGSRAVGLEVVVEALLGGKP